jgi:hypothetical protein
LGLIDASKEGARERWFFGYALAMPDITSPRVLYVKAGLFVVTGVLASAAILIDHPSLKVAGLLALAIWSFARAYYFAFYVIEHYIDPSQRYAGVVSFLRYLFRRRGHGGEGRES